MIGPPPSGVKYPVWAWYMQNGRHCKPDLRRERWGYGPGDEQYSCIELEIPDNEVVLSDFDDWNIILNNGLISYSEPEYEELEEYYKSLPEEQKQTYMHKNWERVFDITPSRSEWANRGFWVQATFWELRSEYIKDVRYFNTAKYAEK